MKRAMRGDQGSALVEFTWLAIILMVPLVWIILSVFEVQRGAFAVSAAARAAGRAYALAPNDASGQLRAEAVATQILAEEGNPGQEAKVTVTCRSPQGNCHVGTAVITVRVYTKVVLPLSPQILGRKAATFDLSSTHTVPIGQYVESAPDSGREDRVDDSRGDEDPDR